jgi:hypothetical protein
VAGLACSRSIPFPRDANGQLNFPHGLAFGPHRNLYAASFGNQKVARFAAADGIYLGDFIPSGDRGLSAQNFLLFRPPPVVPPQLGISISETNAVLSGLAHPFHSGSSIDIDVTPILN